MTHACDHAAVILRGHAGQGFRRSKLICVLALLCRTIALAGNQFNGTIPASIAHTNADGFSLDLSHNQFSGTIPSTWWSWGSVPSCDSECRLLSLMPVILLRSCSVVSLDHNNLTGVIPEQLVSSTPLRCACKSPLGDALRAVALWR